MGNRLKAAIAFAGIVCLLGGMVLVGCSPAADSGASESAAASTQAASGSTAAASSSTSSSSAATAPAPLAVDSPKLTWALSATAQPAIDDSGMDVCVTLVDLTTSERASIDGSKQVVAASMIKLIIAATFLEQVDAGVYSLEDYYRLQLSDFVGGSGTINGLSVASPLAYGDILMRMITVSDNTAANILIRAVGGMDVVNAKAAALGLTNTQLNRLMMDEDAIAQGIENYTSANDVAAIFEMLYRGTLASPESCEFLLEALRRQEDNLGIAQGLPEETVFAHKTGDLDTVRNDGGIVEGEKPYILVCLCSGEGFSKDSADKTMARIAASVNGLVTT